VGFFEFESCAISNAYLTALSNKLQQFYICAGAARNICNTMSAGINDWPANGVGAVADEWVFH
jgi:hypothetical protein